MYKGRATITTNNPHKIGGGQQMAVNVTADLLACTLNTRYNDMALPLDILNLAHYPKTVILTWWE